MRGVSPAGNTYIVEGYIVVKLSPPGAKAAGRAWNVCKEVELSMGYVGDLGDVLPDCAAGDIRVGHVETVCTSCHGLHEHGEW